MAAATMVGLSFSGAHLDLNFDDVTLVVSSVTLVNPGPNTITAVYFAPSGRTFTGSLPPGAPITIPIPTIDQPTLKSAVGRLTDLLPAGAGLSLTVKA